MHRPLLLLSLAAAGCAPAAAKGPCDPFGTGDDPCKEQLYFPSGLAVDPDGDVLYVSNFNADLRYSGGTVAAIDLDLFERAIAAFRVENPPFDAKACRAGKSADDFSRCCRRDLIDPQIIECDETTFMKSAVKVGNFAGSIRVQTRTPGPTVTPVNEGTRCPWNDDSCCPPGMDQSAGRDAKDGRSRDDCADHPKECDVAKCAGSITHNRRLWLPVRGDPSITYIDATKEKEEGSHQAKLSCPDGSKDDRIPSSCNSQRITVRDFHPPIVSDDTSLPPEPFGIALDEGPDYSRLLVTHLSGGEVTLINSGAFHPVSTGDLPAPREKVVLDVRGGFFNADTNGRRGAYALAPLNPRDKDSFWFVTSRLNARVGLFSVFQGDEIVRSDGFSVNGAFLTGDDIRDVAVQADAARAFFVEGRPPSLFTVDTRILQTMSMPTGLPANQVIDIVDVCQGPSHLGMRQSDEPGPPGTPKVRTTRVYVVCFNTGQVAVVDPDLPSLVDTILVGRGPNEIAFNFDPDPDCEKAKVKRACMPEPPAGRRAYITNFVDMNVSVIDLQRHSKTENRVIGRIGLSSPPFNQ
ncbi:MAG: hypothetical protein EXR72_10050 [Myxococcales bacterium]|nr:hypothetical protein [Myxococcales bacterium]